MASASEKQYMVELLCDYPEWWRYNVYIMAVGFDADGENAVFTNLIDKVYDAAYGGAPRTMPADYKTPRVISLTTAPCAYADIYVYVVANTFPASEVIGDSPSFDAELRVSADGTCIDQSTWEVNQWGGLTIVARRVG